MAPDLPTPSGGIKVIYRYVEHLCALGHDARVWHGTPGFAYESWGSTAPVDTGTQLEFAAGDVLVMPETGGSKWSFLSQGQPVVMLCQGMDFVFAGSDFLTDEPGAYPGLAAGDGGHRGVRRDPHLPRPGVRPGFPAPQRARADRGLVPAGGEGEADRPDAAPAARGPARCRPARTPLRAARRLGDRPHRRHDPAAGGRRARPGRDLPLRRRARGSGPAGRRGHGVRLLRRRLHRRRREGVHAPRALLGDRRLRRGRHV